ncbi:conserved hypothetical protein [Vibrio crassostreae]|uniref:hypothetical protein n=1 Tax=Vibrio crassostreae TaxID=246167 RepID=UPI0010540738|nr:hypothetical protein [Vibrio crassostreae]TCW10569.1 hypothetical protein EDB49_101368 [Vibrio crassostreae]CAK3420756.1 conserved hypothetical protein [Vibrio crassostreae]CAK3658714.1 conserved hypothetical protein [Vibrio crassostreae]CAK3874257.1 conserved hypothetical protein [Vibrio crassostreae]
MTNVIAREAGNTSKGFDTQVHRAISLILDKISTGCEQVFCAVEVIEDVLLVEKSDEGELVEKLLEEDKDYTSNFSYRSEPVRNTLVSFFDQYIEHNKDNLLSLCFYAQTGLSNEKIDNKIINNTSGLEEGDAGNYGILKKLVDNEKLTDTELKIALSLFKKEYLFQYNNRKDKKVGFSDIVKGLPKDEFEKFLYSISWNFESNENLDYEQILLKKIRECEFFDYMCDGREYSILHELFYEFVKRKRETSLIKKLLSKDKVENIFSKAKYGNSSILKDSSWKIWETIDLSDLRNLEEKIESVCKDYPTRRINDLKVKLSLAKSEEFELGKDYKSLKARVYRECNELIMDLIDDNELFDKVRIKEAFKQMEGLSIDKVRNLENDYTYNASNDDLISGMVYSLFDDCYLAFDDYE